MANENRQAAREVSDSCLWERAEAVTTDLRIIYSTLNTHNCAAEEGIINEEESGWLMLSVEQQLMAVIGKLDCLTRDMRDAGAAVKDAAEMLCHGTTGRGGNHDGFRNVRQT